MKNTFSKFLLFLLLLICNYSYSQITLHSYKVFRGFYNDDTKTWMYDEPNYVNDLKIVVTSTVIYIFDKANSQYRIFQDNGISDGFDNAGQYYKAQSWRCTDENGKIVIVTACIYTQQNDLVYSVMYNDYCFRYYIKMNGLSNFK